MSHATPRIQAVGASAPPRLEVNWVGGGSVLVDLGSWIVEGGDIYKALRDPALFSSARVGLHGFAIIWGDEDGDLAIDAHHLELLGREQRHKAA